MPSVADTHYTNVDSSPPDKRIVSTATKQFKLICAEDDRPIICYLSSSTTIITVSKLCVDPRWKSSFAVEVSLGMAQATAERLDDALREESVRVLDAVVIKECTVPAIQELLQDLAELWVTSTITAKRTPFSRSALKNYDSDSVDPTPMMPVLQRLLVESSNPRISDQSTALFAVLARIEQAQTAEGKTSVVSSSSVVSATLGASKSMSPTTATLKSLL
ncbi:hypothetical protein C8R44DRAFT_876977 [Mycena epipterygia]|nr:hypothetical protein C8R44DRAFT_876977 [Mycena epipterygia]